MAYNLIVSPKAAADVVEACIYYENLQPGLSARLLSAILSAYNKISYNPQHFSFIAPKRKNNLRDIKLKDFPYLVIFEVVQDTVIVYAVFNTHQKPVADTAQSFLTTLVVVKHTNAAHRKTLPKLRTGY